MPYFGRYHVSIVFERQGFGEDGKDFGIIAARELNLPESVSSHEAVDLFESAFRNIRSVVDKDALAERWEAAARYLSAEKMEKALELWERM